MYTQESSHNTKHWTILSEKIHLADRGICRRSWRCRLLCAGPVWLREFPSCTCPSISLSFRAMRSGTAASQTPSITPVSSIADQIASHTTEVTSHFLVLSMISRLSAWATRPQKETCEPQIIQGYQEWKQHLQPQGSNAQREAWNKVHTKGLKASVFAALTVLRNRVPQFFADECNQVPPSPCVERYVWSLW